MNSSALAGHKAQAYRVVAIALAKLEALVHSAHRVPQPTITYNLLNCLNFCLTMRIGLNQRINQHVHRYCYA